MGNTVASTARRKDRRSSCAAIASTRRVDDDRRRARAPLAMDAPERYEQLIAFLDSNLPSPVDRQEAADGSMQFTGGEPAEVVVSLTETSVLV